MPRAVFEKEIQRLQDEMLVLGSMVGEALIDSVAVLRRRDAIGAQRLIAQDRRINERRFEIEGDALALIATQQPMAGDLRVIAAILEIVTELERIGDYAKGIARINLMMDNGPLLKPLVDIPRMAEKAQGMLQQSLDAFVQRNVEKARSVPPMDDEVDGLYNQVYRELMAYILASPRASTRPTICCGLLTTWNAPLTEYRISVSGWCSWSRARW